MKKHILLVTEPTNQKTEFRNSPKWRHRIGRCRP